MYEWHVMGHYGDGWESVYVCDTQLKAVGVLVTYRENEPQYRHRVRRVWLVEDGGRP
jgi:hypothetical protein